MKQSATIIADSVGPNGKRITTLEVNCQQSVYLELLKERDLSVTKVDVPYEKQRDQVLNDPAMPVLWPKQHRGMQGTEVFTLANDSMDMDYIERSWLQARDNALNTADYLSDQGLSKQLTNRLLEPWVNTKCVITATSWENFFLLRHPWHYETKESTWNGYTQKTKHIVWESEVNLNFPAEYNLQALAIEMKKAIDASEPTVLEEGEWHLPFVTDDDITDLMTNDGNLLEKDLEPMLVDISAARSARTSYSRHMGKTIEDDLKLAKMLRESNHWSPFEHQAQMIDPPATSPEGRLEYVTNTPGLETRYVSGKGHSYWSRNFQNVIQARDLLES